MKRNERKLPIAIALLVGTGVLLVSVVASASLNQVDLPPTVAADRTQTTALDANSIKPDLCDGIEVEPDVIMGPSPINGTADNDLIIGTSAVETINGGDGDDCILGGGGNDTLNGGPGDDVCIGHAGTTFDATCETTDP